MTNVRFYYDLVCPYSYLESVAVEQAEDRGDLAVEWVPFELRPAPRRLLDPRGDHLRVDWTRHVYRRALELGIEIHLPRHQPRSTLPLAACLWATEQGELRPFRRALYECFFCEGGDISRDPEIARCAERAGLDPDAALAGAYSGEYGTLLGRLRLEGEDAGIRGAPSLLNTDGMHHWGMGGVDRLTSGQSLVPRP